MRFSHITFSLRCQYCISKIHFIHVAPSSYLYFKDRVDYLSETIVEELLFCHTILRANEFSLCLGKRKQRINACGEDIDRQHRNNFFSYLAAFLPTHNECFKNLIYLRPKAKYIFHCIWSCHLLDLRRARTLQGFKRVGILCNFDIVNQKIAKEFSPHEIHGTPRKWSTQILAFCIDSKSKKELASFCGFKDLRNFTLKHINPFGYKKTPESLDFPGFVNIIRLSLSR